MMALQRSHFMRSSWIVWGTALLVLSLTAAFVAWRVTTASDGARLETEGNPWMHDGVVVAPLEERPGGVRHGDVVVAMDGRSMELWSQSLFQLTAAHPSRTFGQTTTYTVLRGEERLDVIVELQQYPVGIFLRNRWGIFCFLVVFLLIAVYVFMRRPLDQAARLFFVLSCGWSASVVVGTLSLEAGDLVTGVGFWLYQLMAPVLYLISLSGALHFSLIFPKMKISARYSAIIPLIYIIPQVLRVALILTARAQASTTLDWLAAWPVINGALLAIVTILILVVIVLGHSKVRSDPVAYQKARWIEFAFIVNAVISVVFGLLPSLLLGRRLLDDNAQLPFVLLYPLAIAIGILRYRMFDIDVVINRTLVYGALTVAVVATYVFLVVFVGNLFHVADSLPLSLFATGVVAVGFEPVRERLQHGVNRLMYGERDEPYTVISRLGRRLETAFAPEAVLPTIVETVGQALKLPYVAIALKQGDAFELAASYASSPRPSLLENKNPPEESGDTVIPLVYQQEIIGRLTLAPRAPGESFTTADRRLLEELARHAGVAAHDVRLTSDLVQTTVDLQRSRERLVTIREEERRRLSRDLHDGLGPVLVSQRLNVSVARKLTKQDPDAADALLTEVQDHLLEAITDVRHLVHELRPPILDQLGLVGAIYQYADQRLLGELDSGSADDVAALPRMMVEAPAEGLPALPAAVEVAAYRIVLEALTNVIRYAHARSCVVRLSVDDPAAAHDAPVGRGAALGLASSRSHAPHRFLLRVEVTDDGIGIAPDACAGIGLASMRERAAELGGSCVIESGEQGGTRVAVLLPIPNL